MAVVGVFSVKGGVGKTTIAVDLAWRFARAGHRTLLWDLDPQGGSAFLLGHQPRRVARAAALFQREGQPRALIEPTRYDNLSLLQSDESLRSLDIIFARIGNRKRLAKLTGFLAGEFDRIVFDCPPALNGVSDQVLSAVDLLVVPLPASPLARRSLDMVRADVLRTMGRHPPILPVISMHDVRRRLHRDFAASAELPRIPFASLIEQTAVRRAPIGTFAPWSEPAKALDAVWQLVEQRILQGTPKMAPGKQGVQRAGA